jgi:2-C-methyl-D-erythritol 4-phosphate cytidylyltransferase/2-C-methyl-D-erythritol 2,4-cyclodiphosphate synthase
MGGIDKLDQPLGGRPLLAWSVEAMANAESVKRIVLVVGPSNVDAIGSAPWLTEIAGGRVAIVPGGTRRSDSVRAGVVATDASVVLVHDGARPLASSALADAVARAAAQHGAAVPVLPVADSLKRMASGDVVESVDREGLVRTQTPQGARRDLLLAAFAAAGDRSYTDEAALLEANGVRVATVPGEQTNIKVTEPDDLELVRALTERRGPAAIRFGFGQDSHGFGPGNGLTLGGLEIADAPRLYGHSDGDVVLHALATAVLAACGLGDLGQLFPASDQNTVGIASSKMLRTVVGRMSDAGWRVDRAQVALVGARPRLGGTRMAAMAARIAEMLEVGADSVAVTASTGNLTGPEGAGRVISSTALVTLVRR